LNTAHLKILGVFEDLATKTQHNLRWT
jgi:hypothetical protein